MDDQAPPPECPDPRHAKDAAEFVATMRQLRAWSGATFRQLERRSAVQGTPLPHSTLVTALRREKLPREELLIAFVRACGCPAETVTAWVSVRRRLAIQQAQGIAPPPAPSAPSPGRPAVVPPPAPPATASNPAAPAAAASITVRPRRAARPTLTAFALVPLGIATLLTGGSTPTPHTIPSPQDQTATASVRHELGGPIRIRSVKTGGCLSARRHIDGRIFPMPCAYAFPARNVQPQPDGTYVVATRHPDLGPGCMGIRQLEPRGEVDDDFCGTKGANAADRFWLVHSTLRPNAYRLQIAHTELCIETSPRAGVAVFLRTCDPTDPAQAFTIEPDTRPGL